MRRAADSARARAALVMLLAAFPLAAAAAEFREGANAHGRGDFARARAVFLDLAELGDGPSQYNLGAMALRGEGGPKDRGEAAGWMLAARENGHDSTARAVDELVARLAPAERESADRIVARYGRAALEERVLPRSFLVTGTRFDDPARPLERPRLLSGPAPKYPAWSSAGGKQAIVILRVLLGADGRARDPDVLLSIPPPAEGGRAFVDSAVRALLARRYEPAREAGRPIPVYYNFRLYFRMPETTGILDTTRVAAERLRAADGDPRAQFHSGMIALADRPVHGTAEDAAATGRVREAGDAIVAAAQAGIPDAQLFVGRALARQGETSRAIPWLERAAAAGAAGARTSYGLALLRGPDPDLGRIGPLLDDDAAADDLPAARRAIVLLTCSADAGAASRALALAIAKRLSTDDPDPLTLEAIAAARAGVADRDGAARVQRDAVKRAKRLGWNVSGMQARQDAYAAGRACSDDFLARAVEGLP